MEDNLREHIDSVDSKYRSEIHDLRNQIEFLQAQIDKLEDKILSLTPVRRDYE